jgi:hypothetical protein
MPASAVTVYVPASTIGLRSTVGALATKLVEFPLTGR